MTKLIIIIAIILYFIVTSLPRYDDYDYDPIEDYANHPWKRIERASTSWEQESDFYNYCNEFYNSRFGSSDSQIKDKPEQNKSDKSKLLDAPTSSVVKAPGMKRVKVEFTPDDADIVKDPDELKMMAVMTEHQKQQEQELILSNSLFNNI